MVRRRVYDIPEQEFRDTAAECFSLRDMIRTLDLHDHTNTYHRLRQRLVELGLDVDQFGRGRRPRRFTPEQLAEAVAASRSLRQTLLALGIRAEGGNYKTLRRDITTHGLDTGHFTGQAWRSGTTRPVSPPRPLQKVLVKNSPATTSGIRKRLLREGLIERRCEVCGLTEWMGKPLSFELDHINGISDDHRRENLRMLCPNCHSQTDTYRSRNRGRKRPSQFTQLSIL